MKVKVISLNMWLGGKLFENIQSFVTRENADILCLQEVHHAESLPPQKPWHVVSELAKTLGYPYYAFAPAVGVLCDDGSRIQFGNAILSKLPITNSFSLFYDIPYNGMNQRTPDDYRFEPRNLQHAEIECAGRILHVFNTQGIWGFDGEDNKRRLAMGDIIVREVAGEKPALLMGDFNVLEGTNTIGKIEAHMKSVFKGELKTSFNMRHKDGGGFGSAVVDMMFVSPDVNVLNYSAPDDDVSDHVPLVGGLEV